MYGPPEWEWECLGCGHRYSERFHGATCCTFPGPDFTSAKPIDPETGEAPEPWLGEKFWKFYDVKRPETSDTKDTETERGGDRPDE